MSASLYRWTEKCDEDYCPGDCDYCDREGNEMSREEMNDIKDERDCKSCVWRSEDGCHSWDCEYLSYHDLHEYIEEHPELRGKRNG